MKKLLIMVLGLAVLVPVALWVSQKRQTRRSRRTSKALQNSDRADQDRRDVLAERDFDKNAADTLESEGGNLHSEMRERREYEYQH